jgi:hypothetical protein
VVRVHDLRHANATLALMAGIDVKVVSAMLGHSTTRITQDLYNARPAKKSRARWGPSRGDLDGLSRRLTDIRGRVVNPVGSAWGRSDESLRTFVARQIVAAARWREGRDSNPGAGCPASGFQDRRLRPLGHPPAGKGSGGRAGPPLPRPRFWHDGRTS